jgi:hypothetical protein
MGAANTGRPFHHKEFSMSNTAAEPKKPAKTAAPEPTREPQTLRAVQIKKVPPSGLKEMGFGAHTVLTADVPPDWSYEDALVPEAWANVAHMAARGAAGSNHDMLGSVIEVRRADHAWFAQFYIAGITRDSLGHPNGFRLVCVGPATGADGKCCPVDPRTGYALEQNV